MPRIRQLDIPSVFNNEAEQDETHVEKEDHGKRLLPLIDDSDDELIPTSLNRVTKVWVSSKSGLGCFACGFHELLIDIAAATGTDISVIDDINGIQISGRNLGDVDDALGKLTRIEQPLVCQILSCTHAEANLISRLLETLTW